MFVAVHMSFIPVDVILILWIRCFIDVAETARLICYYNLSLETFWTFGRFEYSVISMICGYFANLTFTFFKF